MFEDVKSIVKDVLTQAEKGKVDIIGNDGFPWTFFTHFYTKVEDKDNIKINSTEPVVFIPNFDEFLNKMDKYLKTARKFYSDDKEYFDIDGKEFDKKLFLDLIVSASNFDLVDFLGYIERRQQILEHEQDTSKIKLGEYKGISIYADIKKNHSNIEAPYRFDVVFDDGENKFLLPSILYGILDDKAQIMGIQNFNKAQTNPLSKKLDRYFRKVNKDVDMEDDIAFVSPNALVSFTVFNEFLSQKEINDVVFNAFMPIRYYCQKESGMHRAKTEEEKDMFLEKHNHNQTNMTDKVVNMFFRYQHHFDQSDVFFDPNRQQVVLKNSNIKDYDNDNIIYDIAKSVDKENEEFLEI